MLESELHIQCRLMRGYLVALSRLTFAMAIELFYAAKQ